MRITSVGHAVLAAMMVALGVLCLIERDLAPVWQFPDGSPALLPYVCAIVSLATGIGLLVPRIAALAARVLLAYLVLWLLLVRGHDLVTAPGAFGAWDGFAELAVIIAAAWVVYVSVATAWDRNHVRFASGEGGVRVAHALLGLAQVPFGVAHFLYMERTIAFVPHYMPAPTFWAYFTGIAFIAGRRGDRHRRVRAPRSDVGGDPDRVVHDPRLAPDPQGEPGCRAVERVRHVRGADDRGRRGRGVVSRPAVVRGAR